MTLSQTEPASLFVDELNIFEFLSAGGYSVDFFTRHAHEENERIVYYGLRITKSGITFDLFITGELRNRSYLKLTYNDAEFISYVTTTNYNTCLTLIENEIGMPIVEISKGLMDYLVSEPNNYNDIMADLLSDMKSKNNWMNTRLLPDYQFLNQMDTVDSVVMLKKVLNVPLDWIS